MSFGIEMDAVRVCENDCAGGDEVASIFVVFRGCVGEACDGSEALDFFDYGADVREIRFVGELGETIAYHAIEFFMGCGDNMGECHRT